MVRKGKSSVAKVPRRLLCAWLAAGVCGAAPAEAQEGPVLFGGRHAVGVMTGYSPVSGPVWGYDDNVRYSPTVVGYRYVFAERRGFEVGYAPEVTVAAVLDEPAPSKTNPAVPVRHVGAGASPVGFELSLRPGRRVQPFVGTHGGFVYFDGRVLSPQGSQWMYTIDFGVGAQVFVSGRSAVELGYRYQHLSNANISLHNPGTDADTFTLGYQRWWGR